MIQNIHICCLPSLQKCSNILKWVSSSSPDRLVLLESPGLPVLEGATVTLRCRAETNSSGLRFDFFKDGLAVSINSTGEMIIHSASKSDEGLYKCSIHEGEESLSNWLAVGGEINAHVHTDGARSTRCLREFVSFHSFSSTSTFVWSFQFEFQTDLSPGGGNSLPAVHRLTGTHIQRQEER